MQGDIRRLRRLLRLAMHILLGLMACLVLAAAAKLRPAGAYSRQQAITRRWAAKLCRILALEIHIHGKANTDSTLFVANHISWLDIAVLQGLLDTRFVAKHEVGEWPVFGIMAHCAGTLFMKRGDHRTTARVADQLTHELSQQRNVLFFPEGTSSDGQGVQRFHARLFQGAVRAHAQVQAVAICYPHPCGSNPLVPFVGDDDLLRHLWPLLRESAVEVRVSFCTPIPARDWQRRGLAELTRAQIIDQLTYPEEQHKKAA